MGIYSAIYWVVVAGVFDLCCSGLAGGSAFLKFLSTGTER
jgi:hypothetical protein